MNSVFQKDFWTKVFSDVWGFYVYVSARLHLPLRWQVTARLLRLPAAPEPRLCVVRASAFGFFTQRRRRRTGGLVCSDRRRPAPLTAGHRQT